MDHARIAAVHDLKEFEPEYIVEHRKSHGKLEFLVKWMNYFVEEATWEPVEYLHHLDMFKQYLTEKELELLSTSIKNCNHLFKFIELKNF